MPEKFEYRLCGFGAAIYMRSTFFVEPLPASRVCSVCGVVPPKVALLPCCHPVCHRCFEVFVSKGNVCGLDEKIFEEKFVEWLQFSDEQLSKLPVRSHCTIVLYKKRVSCDSVTFAVGKLW